MTQSSSTIEQTLAGDDILQFSRSINPIIVREIDGSILFWNQAATRSYGYPEGRAVGHVSHLLLSTVFPEPLAAINAELVRRGAWEGELIHTLVSGEKVKVRSRWELVPNAATVIERNGEFKSIGPASSHLTKRVSRWVRFAELTAKYRIWWLIPLIVTLGLLELIVDWGKDLPLIPLLH